MRVFLSLKNNKDNFVFWSIFLFIVVAVLLSCFKADRLAVSRYASHWLCGWESWTLGNKEEALEAWSSGPCASAFIARPARMYYWRIQALKSLGRHDDAAALTDEMLKKFPFDVYSFMMFPSGGSYLCPSRPAKIDISFHPRPWKDEVAIASEATGVPDIVIWSLMKQESKFRPRALSHSGAVGLMQLMPDTAYEEARNLRIQVDDIYCPKDNILLGASHYARISTKFHGNIIRTAAAYNAGAGVVAR